MPLPLSNAKDLAVRHGADFSFAGLKTAVRQLVQKHLPPPPQTEETAAETPPALASDGADGGDNAGEEAAEVAAAAAAAAVAAREREREVIRANIAACFQARAVQHLSQRVERALGWAIELAAGAAATAQEQQPQEQQQQQQVLRGMVVAGGVAANKSVRAAMSSCAARRGVVMHCPPPRLCVDNGVMVAWSGVERLHLNLWYALHCTPLHKENKPTPHCTMLHTHTSYIHTASILLLIS